MGVLLLCHFIRKQFQMSQNTPTWMFMYCHKDEDWNIIAYWFRWVNLNWDDRRKPVEPEDENWQDEKPTIVAPDTFEMCTKLQPIWKTMCYGSWSMNASYTNSDNETDIDFSIWWWVWNPWMKWNSSSSSDPSSVEFTQSIIDCIDAGETALITFTDVDWNSYSFPATWYDNADPNADSFFVWPWTDSNWSWKLASATLTCATQEACNFFDCDKNEIVWKNSITWENLTDAEVATLRDCPSSENVTKKEVCVISWENGIAWQRRDSEWNAAPRWPNKDAFPTWNTHINWTPDEVVTITNNWSLVDTDFPLTWQSDASDRDISSQEFYCASVNITETMLLRDNNGNTWEYISIYLQDCNKDMVEIVRDYYSRPWQAWTWIIREFCPWVYKLWIQINDYSVFWWFNLQYSTDNGVTWINFPISETYLSPKIEKKTVLCYNDGTITNLDWSTFDEKTIDCNIVCHPLTREQLPDFEVDITDGCDDVDWDQANYVDITREIIIIDWIQTTTFYTDFWLPTQAEYWPVTRFVDCDTWEDIWEPPITVDCEDWEIIDAYTPTWTNWVNVERRNTNAVTWLPTNTTVPSDVFNWAVDYSWMPWHPNWPDWPIVVESDLTILDQVNDQSQFRYWTYLYITEEMRIRENFPRAEAVDYFLWECCGEVVKTWTWVYPNTWTWKDITLQPWVHYIGWEVFDATAYSGVRYQYSTDNGATWANIPAWRLYSKKPSIQKCPVKICPETGRCADAKTSVLLWTETTLCPPILCGPVASSDIQCTAQTYYKIEGTNWATEKVRIDWDAVTTTTASWHTYDQAFTWTDAEWLPAHPNTPTSTNTIQWASTTNYSWAWQDQAQSDFYLYVPKWVEIREFNATAETVWVRSSKSCWYDMEEVLNAPYTNAWPNVIWFYDRWIYRFRLYSHDVTVNWVANLQYNDNGTRRNIPVSRVFVARPEIVEIKWRYCEDGNFWNTDKSESIDLSDDLISCSPIVCDTSWSSSSSSWVNALWTLTLQP